jgi:hypothetical protein
LILAEKVATDFEAPWVKPRSRTIMRKVACAVVSAFKGDGLGLRRNSRSRRKRQRRGTRPGRSDGRGACLYRSRRGGDPATRRISGLRNRKTPWFSRGFFLLSEAPPGFEPGVEVLQTSALPLGYGALLNLTQREYLSGRTAVGQGDSCRRSLVGFSDQSHANFLKRSLPNSVSVR